LVKMSEKVLFAWSGGKDSAMALYTLQKDCSFEVAALLTTVTEDYGRISMHGVREELLERQAESLGFPLEKVYIPAGASGEEYEKRMGEKLLSFQGSGVTGVAFGDIFLEDLRKYREEKLKGAGMKGFFPVWKQSTSDLARVFIDSGFKAVVVCVDSKVLNKDFAGRMFDRQFLSDLPAAVDPCGENGEFHTFVYDGPIFHQKIGCRTGEVVLRDNRFYYCDLLG
jgi:uncharacterized protein (TIGR00290 family)